MKTGKKIHNNPLFITFLVVISIGIFILSYKILKKKKNNNNQKMDNQEEQNIQIENQNQNQLENEQIPNVPDQYRRYNSNVTKLGNQGNYNVEISDQDGFDVISVIMRDSENLINIKKNVNPSYKNLILPVENLNFKAKTEIDEKVNQDKSTGIEILFSIVVYKDNQNNDNNALYIEYYDTVCGHMVKISDLTKDESSYLKSCFPNSIFITDFLTSKVNFVNEFPKFEKINKQE